MIGLILGVLIAMLVVMGTGWVFQRARNNGGWTDVFWTYGTGLTAALAALAADGPLWRRGLVAGLMAVWSLRLGTYVAVRVAGGPEDVRYATLRREWGANFQRKMLGVLLVQAPVTALLAIGVVFAARQPDPSFRFADALGVLILAGSIAGEGLADTQMKRFKAGKPGREQVCDVGLWGWSRHPNYFFEVAGWLAYPVIAFDSANLWTLLAWIAPVLMFVVIRYGTGIPPLEAAMVAAKGDAYRRYQARVSALLPWPPRQTAQT